MGNSSRCSANANRIRLCSCSSIGLRSTLRASRRCSVLNAQVVGQGELDLNELISGQVIDWVTHDIAEIDRADLVDQQPRHLSLDLKLGSMNGRPG